MSQVIRIPSEVYSRLEQHAEGFDTPANVIEKLLNHFEGVDQKASHESSDQVVSRRDSTKYSFNNHTYGKGRLVLAIIKEYIASNPETLFEDLLLIFPKSLQGSTGVFSKHKDAQEIYERTRHKRHFLKSNELIQLSDCVVAVSTEWGAMNIDAFIRKAQSIGYTVL